MRGAEAPLPCHRRLPRWLDSPVSKETMSFRAHDGLDTCSSPISIERSSTMQQRITTNLWFDDNAEEAAEYYCSIFKNSRVVSSAPYTDSGMGEPGKTMVVEWELDGQ